MLPPGSCGQPGWSRSARRVQGRRDHDGRFLPQTVARYSDAALWRAGRTGERDRLSGIGTCKLSHRLHRECGRRAYEGALLNNGNHRRHAVAQCGGDTETAVRLPRQTPVCDHPGDL
ncbi:MAG: hypothetical protein MZV64_31665 [Ignavibacteriales bacterium]|nr:hypothetical protein [Ignavibacteriales bacterium]